ncbi:SIMPL domain-containing protein [Undibacterium curvum]|uniref:SIMPL domain-containing protein n=1 Tax=Undibacterium curvum TaxID=2762294 RepID=UPI003D0DDEB4
MKKVILLAAAMSFAIPVYAQSLAGTVLTVGGSAEIKVDNDQANLSFYLEEQDKDKAQAASRLNQKMKSGTELIKKEDPQAELMTRNYYTYPVYSDEVQVAGAQPKKRQITGWRVGQYLEVKTINLKQLPSTVASAQKVMSLNGIHFGLSPQAAAKLEEERIQAGYKNFSDKLAMVVNAMGRKLQDVQIEAVDFDGAALEMPQVQMAAAPMMLKGARMADAVAEPSFEPGSSSLSIRVNGKVRLK